MAKKKKDKKELEKKKPVPKKKKKRGRPKKRGRKKKYYKPKRKTKKAQKRKGFGSNSMYNRVRVILWANFKDDFNSYREFISNDVDSDGNKIKGSSIISKVLNECRDVQCTDEDIIAIYNNFNIEPPTNQGDTPIVPDSYFSPNNYWTLITENIYDGLDERLWLVSPMLLNEPPFFLGILGEDRCLNENNEIVDLAQCEEQGNRLVLGKKYRFQPFVDWCNQLQAFADIEMDSLNAPQWKFIGIDELSNEPYWNEETNRWEVQVVPCLNDDLGTIDTFGFDPSDLEPEIPDDFDFPTPQETEGEEEPPVSQVEQVQIDEIQKTGKVERLEKKKAGILKEIDTYIKLGDRGMPLIDDAIERINKINDELEKID